MNRNQDQNSHTTQAGLPSQTEQTSTDTNPRIYVACLAARQCGQRFILIEKAPVYFKAACDPLR
jgi:hypothetical protein